MGSIPIVSTKKIVAIGQGTGLGSSEGGIDHSAAGLAHVIEGDDGGVQVANHHLSGDAAALEFTETPPSKMSSLRQTASGSRLSMVGDDELSVVAAVSAPGSAVEVA